MAGGGRPLRRESSHLGLLSFGCAIAEQEVREGQVGGVLSWDKSKEGRDWGLRSLYLYPSQVPLSPPVGLLPPQNPAECAWALLQVGTVEKLPGPGIHGQSGPASSPGRGL